MDAPKHLTCFIRYRCFRHVDFVASTWLSNRKLLWSCIPNSFIHLTCSISDTGWGSSRLRREQKSSFVFCKFISMPCAWHQAFKFSISSADTSCSSLKMATSSVQSSANLTNLFRGYFTARSAMYNRKSRGPVTEPCGTPFVTGRCFRTALVMIFSTSSI